MTPLDFIEQYPSYGPGAGLDGTPYYTIFDRDVLLPCGITVQALAYTPRGIAALLHKPVKLVAADLARACLVRHDLILLGGQIITEPDIAQPWVEVAWIVGNVDSTALATVAYLQNIRLFVAIRMPTGKAREQYRFIPISAHKADSELYAAYAVEGSIRDALLSAHQRNRDWIEDDPDDFYGSLMTGGDE